MTSAGRVRVADPSAAHARLGGDQLHACVTGGDRRWRGAWRTTQLATDALLASNASAVLSDFRSGTPDFCLFQGQMHLPPIDLKSCC